MDLALSAVQTVFAALGCSQLRDFLSDWGYKSELESLESTVETIRAVFRTVDRKQAQGVELNEMELVFIEKLKDAVYDVDDLLDEFATLATQQQQQRQNCKKVRRLLSRLEKFGAAYKMSRELKNIRKKLDGIASDADKYSFKIDDQPIRKRREETCSYVYEKDIIGRDDDKKRVIDMLSDSKVEGDVVVLAIVGMGGLGKTALAQLVYNDPRIQKEFPFRLWVCVSDQDQNQFNVKAILASIYKSTNPGVDDVGHLGLDSLVHKLREKLKQHKYFLVLDDVWTENHSDWLKLKGYLVGLGQWGNKIVVTTRSLGTAIAVESNNPYKLKALSDENSWHLFERMVGKEQANSNNLVEIGKNIVKKCANVSLAIRVVGSLLHGQPVNKWQTIQQSGLAEIKNDGNDIIPILKFSYNHLTPSLKSCFTFCAIFPKDFRIEKGKVIDLWMAHQYVEPLDAGQSIEEAAEEYFQILVRRCFFQDVKRSEIGETQTFQIHDLIHDMAQQASGKDIFVADSATMKLDEKTRHLCDSASYARTEGFVTAASAKIRTYARVQNYRSHNVKFPVKALLVNWRSLRVLDLRHLNITELPNAIGGLLHLRWIALSGNRMKMLPKSLRKLVNLQFLDLRGCYELEELPKDFSELVSLRILLLTYDEDQKHLHGGLVGLRYMPLGMEKMAYLTSMNRFVLGQRKSSMKQEVRLEDRRVPRNLRGSLKICISGSYEHSKEYGGGGYLCNTQYLKSISINWPYGGCKEERMGHDEVLLEDLQPNGNLQELKIRWYQGLRIPRWAREDGLAASLPNLVKIVLDGCHGLKELPWLGTLQYLKTLQLRRLGNLEYMENKERGINIGSSSDGAAAAAATAQSSSTAVEIKESSVFFPSLENLVLHALPKLKGWWRGMRDGQIVSSDGSAQTASVEQLSLFPRLSHVNIRGCPNLRFIPLGPAVDALILLNSAIVEEEDDEKVVSSSSSNDCGNWRSYDPKIKEIRTDNVRFLKSLPMAAFQCLTDLDIGFNDKVESLSEVENVFQGCSSSLRFLTVTWCEKLRSISSGLQHLTALESLELCCLPELSFDETQGQEEDGVMGTPWKCVAESLRSLTLDELNKVVELPKGMCYLTALQSLKIIQLPLKYPPAWIGCLTSLSSIEITEQKFVDMSGLTDLRYWFDSESD